MKRRITLAILALACGLATRTSVHAHDMSGMDMDAGGMASMNGAAPDPSNMKEGEVEAMSDGPEMDHDMHMGHGAMKNMALHMAYTNLRPASDADKKRAGEILAELKKGLRKYQDVHAAEADGYKPFHPEFKQPVAHFTKKWNALKAALVFNASEPTSLLYQRTPGGGYKLIGAMYTDRKGATEVQLDDRVPLSVARWHRHINLCFPPRGADMKSADWTKFGFNGSIATEDACDAAGGRFYPQVFGWMVHVYPWESDPKLVWAH